MNHLLYSCIITPCFVYAFHGLGQGLFTVVKIRQSGLQSRLISYLRLSVYFDFQYALLKCCGCDNDVNNMSPQDLSAAYEIDFSTYSCYSLDCL